MLCDPAPAVTALNAFLWGSVPAGWDTSQHPLVVFMRNGRATLHEQLL